MLQQQRNPWGQHNPIGPGNWQYKSNTKVPNTGFSPEYSQSYRAGYLAKTRDPTDIHKPRLKNTKHTFSTKPHCKIWIPTPVHQNRKIKNHIAKSTFHQTFQPTKHKGRRVPLHLIHRVEKELRKLIEDKQIKIKLDKCSDEYFISPVVNTVKHDKSIKMALESKKNKRRHSQKQIPNAKPRWPYGHNRVQN